jgi:hypothetical protein
MVLEEIRVLVEVDCFERKLAETLATVCVRGGLRGDTTAAELGACAILSRVSYMPLVVIFQSLPGSPSLRVFSSTSIELRGSSPVSWCDIVCVEGSAVGEVAME